jgi:hypothetical protein
MIVPSDWRQIAEYAHYRISSSPDPPHRKEHIMRAVDRPSLVTFLLLTLLAALHAAAQTPCAPTANPILLDITSSDTYFPAQITKVVERGYMAPCGPGQFCPLERHP